MACFLVSTAAAIGATVAQKVVAKKENKKTEIAETEIKEYKFGCETKWSTRLKYLATTLWTGSFLLAGEHVIHGEVVPFPPFLTAASDPASASEMLHEMGTVGVGMFALLVVAWGVGTFLWDLIKYRKHKKAQLKEANEEV
ncbi:MAG: hypothetical protein IJU10_01430 [Clostridia bacterium]|nr:hypothetical protein [Clostridia bacterium]